MSEVILQIVSDVFQIEGRGTIVLGSVGASWNLAKRGDKIELRTPDGRRIKTAIKDMEVFAEVKATPEPMPCCGVQLTDIVASEELPRGTEMLRISDD
jgi:translation elongation factor EF-Tu-like GTPase